jgi:serine phosphatase RsbU (regulator of sigma subunit)
MPDIDEPQNLEQERLQLLFRQTQTTSIVAAIGAVACGFIIYSVMQQPGVWLWVSAAIVATVVRLRLYRRFFRTRPGFVAPRIWLRSHAYAAIPTGIIAGALPLLDFATAPHYVRELQTLVPALVLMSAITSFGVYFSQYLTLLAATVITTVATQLWAYGSAAVPTVIMLTLFAPILGITARRYQDSIADSLAAKHRSERLVEELTLSNNEFAHQNEALGKQQDLLEQEEELAKHVFQQLIIGGDHRLPGIHTWNQAMGSLSGDLIQTARGPTGESYVLLCDFTGHGLPAALGALPASSVFLAMSSKGLTVDVIARELNAKLRQLLPVGYFCCAALIQLSADRTRIGIWNGGLPPILINRANQDGYDQFASHSLPLGVVDDDQFEADSTTLILHPGDVLYAYSDGLTEAEDIDGEMWGKNRLHDFVLQQNLDAPRLPALIDAVLEHVNLAPPSDDISVVEIEATPAVMNETDASPELSRTGT